MPLNKPYRGAGRKLILAIDVGTTYSGVSYCLLDPGEVPVIHSVTRYPGQEGDNRLRDTKIPSILYYDQEGNLCAVGAEAKSDATRLDAEDENWTLVEWFKLHLRPEGMHLQDADLPKLPPNIPVLRILADYLSYLFKCAKDHISETHPNGRHVLQSEAAIEFVLSHPNGWEGRQQNEMRRAAIMAGLIPDTEAGRSRIHFVTEGEASLHFCVANGLAQDLIQTNKSMMIIDAGGGTVDLSTYKITSFSPVTATESVDPDCLFQGSTFVNNRAQQFLAEKLKLSRYGNPEDIQTMLDYFESSTKPTFRDISNSCPVKFGSLRDNDEKRDIKRGSLTLSGSQVATFLSPSIRAIEPAITKQCHDASTPVSVILLVGGFAASPYLRSELQSFARREHLELFCPESQPAKAVAEGALSSYFEHVVMARVSRYTYGSRCVIPFYSFLPEHASRVHNVRFDAAGTPILPNHFGIILPKGTLVSEDKEFECSFTCESFDPISTITSDITCYKGTRQSPEWTDEEPAFFTTLCTVRADITHVPKTPRTGARGKYYSQTLKVILLFGLAKLKAQLSWIENGEEKRSSATIVYDGEAAD